MQRSVKVKGSETDFVFTIKNLHESSRKEGDPARVLIAVITSCGKDSFMKEFCGRRMDKLFKAESDGIKLVLDAVESETMPKNVKRMFLTDFRFGAERPVIIMRPVLDFDLNDFVNEILNYQQRIPSYLSARAASTWYKNFWDVGDALDYLHDADVIHRDVALQNLVVNGNTQSGNIAVMKIIDFGLAASLKRGEFSGDYFYGRSQYRMPKRFMMCLPGSRQVSGYGMDLWAFSVMINMIFFPKPPQVRALVICDHELRHKMKCLQREIEEDAKAVAGLTEKKPMAEVRQQRIQKQERIQKEQRIQKQQRRQEKQQEIQEKQQRRQECKREVIKLSVMGFGLLAICSIATGGIILPIVFGVLAILSLGSAVRSNQSEDSALIAPSLR